MPLHKVLPSADVIKATAELVTELLKPLNLPDLSPEGAALEKTLMNFAMAVVGQASAAAAQNINTAPTQHNAHGS